MLYMMKRKNNYDDLYLMKAHWEIKVSKTHHVEKQ